MGIRRWEIGKKTFKVLKSGIGRLELGRKAIIQNSNQALANSHQSMGFSVFHFPFSIVHFQLSIVNCPSSIEEINPVTLLRYHHLIVKNPKDMTNSDVKRLYRSKKDRVLGGVCAGIANYFNVDPVLIRVAWVVGFFIGGVGFLAYLIAWIIMPEEPGV